jgi:hypothetical protein
VSWHPNDLVSDVDLLDYEAGILQMGQTTWQSKRTKALEDWLFPILKGRGLNPHRLRTRYEADAVYGYTGATYSDKTAASQDTTADDLNLATIFASVGADALYIGSVEPFKGLFIRLLESVNTAAAVLSVAYWNGNWENLLISDGTIQVAGKTLSAGGSVTWLLPVDWATRVVNASASLYWAKVTISATPTSAKAGQISCIRGSALRAPATFRTLQLIFQEAPTGGDGPWREKAQFYKDEADAALQRALPLVGGEFDSDESDVVDTGEADQTTDQVGGGWALVRA